jgi:L-alanine-DL-glutamate epimerase-like enolase superfamily enzyme
MAEMRLRRLELKPLDIPFTVAFRHASAERSATATVWVDVEFDSGVVGCGESCPREYVTGESLSTVQGFASRHQRGLREHIVDVASLRDWMASNTQEIDANPAAWCAIELAILDGLAKEADQTAERLLSLPELDGTFVYTAVVGDAAPQAFAAAAEQYRRFGFSDFKLKLSGDLERDRAKMAVVRCFDEPSIRVRVDANNLWSDADEGIRYLRSLDYPFFAIEEPLGPNQYEQLARIADVFGCRIILDESLLRAEQLAALPDPAHRFAINVRVSKMGGLLRSLSVVDAARASGCGIIVGAQVGETSLLTRVALPVARACGDALIAQEGAFGTRLLAHDVCDPPLMFGHGGVLDAAAFPMLRRPGFGLPGERLRARRGPSGSA